MTKKEALDIWAPPDSLWSRFTKPVLFSFMEHHAMYGAVDFTESWPVPCEPDMAMIVDAPGREGVAIGMSAAANGYRPIPLYNALPFVVTYRGDEIISTVTVATRKLLYLPAVVDLIPIMASLHQSAETLSAMNLPSSAPPAFLLDANRAGRGIFVKPGWLDNRSFVSALDVPSGAFLKEHGITRIVLVQTGSKPRADLRLILMEWQREGIQILLQTPWEPWNPRPDKLKPLSWPVRWFHLLAMALGYHRTPSGPFGRIVPSSG